MPQQVKLLAAKPDDLWSTLRTHWCKEKTSSAKVSSDLHTSICTHAHIHRINNGKASMHIEREK